MDNPKKHIIIDPRLLNGLPDWLEADNLADTVSDDDLTAHAMSLLQDDEHTRIEEVLASSEAMRRRMDAIQPSVNRLKSPDVYRKVNHSQQHALDIANSYHKETFSPKSLLDILKPKSTLFPSGRISIDIVSLHENGFNIIFEAVGRALGSAVSQSWAPAGGLQARGSQPAPRRPILTVDVDDPEALEKLAAVLYDCLAQGISYTIELGEKQGIIEIAERDDKNKIEKKLLNGLKKR